MESIFIHQEFHPKFQEQNVPHLKNTKIFHKNTISYNKIQNASFS